MAAPKNNTFYKSRSKHGRDKIFSSPDELLQAAYEYFEWCDANPWKRKDWVGKDSKEVIREIPRPYTLSGLYIFLNINKKTWALYQNREDFIPITTRVHDIIYTQKFEGAAVGVFNSNIIARELGLRDSKDITTGGQSLNAAPDLSKLTDEELEYLLKIHQRLADE